MIKMYCDKCKNEVKRLMTMPIIIPGYSCNIPEALFIKGKVHLCDGCLKKLEYLHIDVADFMEMSN